MNEREIFAAALAQPTEAERQAFLNELCDDDMRQRIEHLLKEQSHLGSFLDHPPLEADAAVLNRIEATIGYGKGSTRDYEKDPFTSGRPDIRKPLQDPDDEIPLGYLEPATRQGSLGRLGHYEILEVIGRGAFGTVLRGFDEKLERIVAIKVLAPEMAATSPARKRFLREARSSAQVRHENVVAIHAVEDDPIPYLVMEYIPGQTLQERLDGKGPLDLPNVLRLSQQIADGMAAAHEQGLIHRDIKPGNILLEGGIEERVKLTDFGLARTADDASLTHSGMIAGTPLYMAPEQALGRKLDQRADLFSFGSVMYQMLSGRPPFRAATTVAVLKRVAEETPRPIQEIIPEVPAWMCKLIGHLHSKDPDKRYSSAKEVSALLAKCVKELEGGRIPQVPDPQQSHGVSVERAAAVVSDKRSRLRLHSPLTMVAAVVLVLLSVIGISEATGVTQFASTVIRLATGSGTLVIETDDPGVKLAINGQEVTITGSGVEQLTLRPGEYTLDALKDGQPVKQELVSITRNGRTVVRMSLEPTATIANSADNRTNGSPKAKQGLASGQPVDLIALLEPSRDFLDDRLKVQNGKLVTPKYRKNVAAVGAIGMIPYAPVPLEYDIELQLERVSNQFAGFNFGLIVGGRQVAVGMDSGYDPKVWGLDFLDGEAAHMPLNETRNPGRRLIIGETSDVTIQVRQNHIAAIYNGETLVDWTGDPQRLSIWDGYKLPQSDSLFFVAQADFVVHKMVLIPRGLPASR